MPANFYIFPAVPSHHVRGTECRRLPARFQQAIQLLSVQFYPGRYRRRRSAFVPRARKSNDPATKMTSRAPLEVERDLHTELPRVINALVDSEEISNGVGCRRPVHWRGPCGTKGACPERFMWPLSPDNPSNAHLYAGSKGIDRRLLL